MAIAPSGEQYEIAFGGYRATVVEVGGGIRSCDLGDRPVLQPYGIDAMCDAAHGAPLIPWPNRIEDGRYAYDGAQYQLGITEPDKHNAIHGLLRWRPWQALEHTADRVVMTNRLYPMQGYPFALDIAIEYTLTIEGLVVRTTATNIGSIPCPYGCGQHPYLSPGAEEIDACALQLAAGTRILTSSDRQLPVGTESVRGTAYDFAKPRLLGNEQIDHAFTDLQRDGDGKAWVRMHGTDGMTAAWWVDSSYPFVELFTADTLEAPRRRRGLGVEPMTCPPNAFQSGQQVVRLDPGESLTTAWGVQLTPAVS
jgi:aldose 1-epimerase